MLADVMYGHASLFLLLEIGRFSFKLILMSKRKNHGGCQEHDQDWERHDWISTSSCLYRYNCQQISSRKENKTLDHHQLSHFHLELAKKKSLFQPCLHDGHTHHPLQHHPRNQPQPHN